MTARWFQPIRGAVFSLGCMLIPALVGAQQTNPGAAVARAVDSNVIRGHLEFLSSDLLEGRAPATRGGRLAAAYIAAQFERLGLVPAGDSGTWYHRVPVISLVPDPTLRIEGPNPVQLGYREDYVLWSMRNETEVRAEGSVVFAGYGIVAPEYHWNDYEGLDVRGKFVMVLVNDPGLRDSTVFRGRMLTYYGRWTYKLEEAARQGAAGILLVHTPESATYPWSTVTSSWTGPQVRLESDPTSLLVAGWLTEAAATDLVRRDGGNLAELMATAARRGFRGQALEVRVQAGVRSTLARSTTANVVARYPGQGPQAAEAVLIGGHYDHLGVRAPVNGDSIYNGAEDNASGTAAVLAAAEAFVRSGVRPRRSLLFMAFAAEESGLLGSQAFAARPSLPLRDLAAVINLDVMNLYGRTADISALGTDQSSLGEVFTQAARAEELRVTVDSGALYRGSFFRSDHFPLARVGVPSLSLEGGNVYLAKPAGWGEERRREYTEHRYHQPSDELLDWFSMGGVVQQVRVVVRAALTIANALAQPTWQPGSEFRAAGEARIR